MKKLFTHPITYCVLFFLTIGSMAFIPTQQNKPIPRVVLSLQDADTALVQLSTVYEIIEEIDCLTQGKGRIAKKSLISVMNKIQARVDTTGKK